MQGSEVTWPQDVDQPVNTCVWAGCGCVFGGNGISVSDVDY